MKRHGSRVALVYVGAIFILCLVTCAGCLLACNALQERPPERGFETDELFIDVSVFPPEWSADPAGPQRHTGQAPLGGGPETLQRRVLTFDVGDGHGGAFEKIYRMASIKVAAKEFERQITLWFPKGKYWTPWERPTELKFESSIADQFRVACAHDTARSDLAQKCHFIGQYEEYLVWFSTDMSPDFMTYQDLEHVLEAIDERMEHYLMEGAE